MYLETKNDQVNTLRLESPLFLNICNDLESVRFFYSELIGLKENDYKKGEFIGYKSKGKIMMFFQADELFEESENYFEKYNKYKSKNISWCIKIDIKYFVGIVDRLINSGVKTISDTPEWKKDGFWTFPVFDPVGNMVEIYSEPAKFPSFFFNK